MLSKPLNDRSSMITLKNDRLEVNLLKPGENYIGGRFDWTGFITEITLDTCHHFGASHRRENDNAILGRGLCNEFGMNTPIGIDGIEPGRLHPKIGVGLMPYIIDDSHLGPPPSAIQPYRTTYHLKENSVVFHSHPEDCRGYAVDYTKTVTLNGNHLIVDYRLENVGSKNIITEEYCHNFILMDDYKAGPDYQLHCPIPLEDDLITEDNPLTKDLLLTEYGLTWRCTPSEVFYFNTKVESLSTAWWQLVHEPSGLSMKETVNFAPHHFALWGESHVISPEIFVPIDLAPGKVKTWQRVFEFDHRQKG